MGTFSRLRRAVRQQAGAALPLSVQQKLRPGAGDPFVAKDDQTRSIFIHVPKAAGTSLKALIYGIEPAIAEAAQGERDQEIWRRHQASGLWPRGHRRIAEYYMADPERAVAYLKFAFVRNPWDRLLSAYTYLSRSPDRTPDDMAFAAEYLDRYADFEQFVLALRNPMLRMIMRDRLHFRPQCSYICLPHQEGHAMDFLGRFERLPEDTAALLEKLGRPASDLPHVRASTRRDYRDAYSTPMREIAAQLYARDIALLDYAF